jgi:hypothetical protein
VLLVAQQVLHFQELQTSLVFLEYLTILVHHYFHLVLELQEILVLRMLLMVLVHLVEQLVRKVLQVLVHQVHQ